MRRQKRKSGLTQQGARLKLSDCIPFGQYRGHRILDIAVSDLSYLQWLNKSNPYLFAEDVLWIVSEKLKLVLRVEVVENPAYIPSEQLN